MRVIEKREGVIFGLDPSLTGTGIASAKEVTTLSTKGYKDTDRLIYIRDEVMEIVRDARLVVIEGFAYNKSNKAHEIGGLGWILRVAMAEEEVPYLEVAPTKLKKFATGKGNAGKIEVVTAAVNRLNISPKDDNQADAAWLREFGLHYLGARGKKKLPQVNLEALAGV